MRNTDKDSPADVTPVGISVLNSPSNLLLRRKRKEVHRPSSNSLARKRLELEKTVKSSSKTCAAVQTIGIRPKKSRKLKRHKVKTASIKIELDDRIVEFDITAGLRLSSFLRDKNGNLILNAAQVAAVKDIGFGGFLDIKLTKVPYGIVLYLVKNFVPISRIQHINNSKIDSYYITPDDVHDILGLPLYPSYPVPTSTPSDELVQKMCQLWQVEKESEIKVGKGKYLFTLYEDGGDEFKKVFVLYAISCIIFPDCDEKLKRNLFRAVDNISDVKRYDWCGYTLDRLCAAVERLLNSISESELRGKAMRETQPGVKFGGNRTINGCVLVLLVAYLYRVPFKGVRYNRSLPLIQHLTDSIISERTLQEELAGYGTSLVETSSVYPISSIYRDFCARGTDETQTKHQHERTDPEVHQGHEQEQCEPVDSHEESDDVPESSHKEDATALESMHKETALSDEVSGSDRFIRYKIPSEFKTDAEIRRESNNGLEAIGSILKRDLSIVLSEHSKRMAAYECSKADKTVCGDDECGLPDDPIFGNEQWLSLIDALTKTFFKSSDKEDKNDNITIGATSGEGVREEKESIRPDEPYVETESLHPNDEGHHEVNESVRPNESNVEPKPSHAAEEPCSLPEEVITQSEQLMNGTDVAKGPCVLEKETEVPKDTSEPEKQAEVPKDSRIPSFELGVHGSSEFELLIVSDPNKKGAESDCPGSDPPSALTLPPATSPAQAPAPATMQFINSSGPAHSPMQFVGQPASSMPKADMRSTVASRRKRKKKS